MFGTFRYDLSTKASSPNGRRKNLEVQLQPAQATAGFFPPHAACNTCRAKKLRCSGHKPACNRCQATRLKCQYTQTTEKRRRKASAQPTEPTAQSRRESSTSGRRPSDHDDGQAEVSESIASGIDDTIMGLWEQTSSEELRANHHVPMNLDDATFEGSEYQNAARGEISVSVSTGNMFESARDLMHQQEMPDHLWDPLGSPGLDLTDWDNVVAFSPGSTKIQSQDHGHGHGHDQQRTSVPRTRHTGSVSNPPFPTMLHRHEGRLGEQIAEKSRHEGTSTVHSSPPPNPYLSPESTTTATSGEASVNSSKGLSPADHCTSTNGATGAQCAWLQNSVALLDDISNRIFQGSSSVPFDVGLGFLKMTLSKCSATFECTRCICRSDFCMLLAVVMERLVTLSEDVALEHALITHPAAPEKGANTGWSERTGASTDSRRFGSYDLSSMEHGIIARSLLTLHVQSCRVLVKKMAHVARLSNREAQVHLLGSTEQQIDHLLALLGDRTDGTPT